MTSKHWDIESIKHANTVRGMHWFDKSTLRFFSSRVGSTVYQGPGGVYFTSSEQFDARSPRLYSVRKFNPETGGVETVGEFQRYGSRSGAVAAAKRFAARGSDHS